MDIREKLREVPDFPKKGILFYDVTPILSDPKAYAESINQLKGLLQDVDFDLIIGPEARGFLFGAPLSIILGKPFVPVRKAGKLPYKTLKKSYALEYGAATVEIHQDAVKKGQRAVIVDDLLATGGTSAAICGLVEELGGCVVCQAYLIELEALNGRQALKGCDIRTLIKIS